MTFQILHISDLHLKEKENFDRSVVLGPLIERIKKDKLKGFRPEIVAITGDIAFSGKKSEYEIAKKFFDDLLQCLELSEDRLFIVPGNHDVDRTKYRKSDIPKYDDMRDLNDELENSYYREDLLKGMSAYFEFITNNYSHLEHLHDKLVPFVNTYHSKADKNIAIVGLNSAWMCRKSPDEREIAIGEYQIASAIKELPDVDIRLFLFHHPINWLWPEDSNICKNYFNNSVLLTGHLHDPSGGYFHDFSSKFFQFQAGAAYLGSNSDWPAKFHYITFDFRQNKILLDFRKYVTGRRLWSIDSETGDDGKIILDLSDTEVVVVRTAEDTKAAEEHLERRVSILAEADLIRLNNTIQYVRNSWERHEGPPWQKFHNQSHNQKVEIALYKLIPPKHNDEFTSREWFYLLSSVWLHDIGMIIGLNEEDENTDEWCTEVYKNHHIRTHDYILQKYSDLNLNQTDACIISKICKYHRKYEDIFECDIDIEGVSVRLLAAYLRLAVATHVDDMDALSSDEYYRLLYDTGVAWKDKFHWLKCKWIKDIIPQPDDLCILIKLYNTKNISASSGFIPETLKNNLSDDLSTVREILIRGQITSFLDVKTEKSNDLTDDAELELELIRSNIRLEELSSASEAFDIILTTLFRIVSINDSGYKLLKSYLEEIKKIIKVRPCHALIRSILEKIEEMMLDKTKSDDEKLVKIEEKLTKLRRKRKNNLSKLATNAKAFLLDGGSILLFGYSSLIIKALDHMPSINKKDTTIYISECRGKTQYNYSNEIVYSDGYHYAQRVREIGLKDVHIIPDICVANLMKRRLIHKVLFGANGIRKADGSFGHTCGHLAVADLAAKYEVPVYVIADTAKIGEIEWDKDLNRDVEWLTRDRKCLQKLKTLNIHEMNPREDQVEPDGIKMIITEVGAFPPNCIPRLEIDEWF